MKHVLGPIYLLLLFSFSGLITASQQLNLEENQFYPKTSANTTFFPLVMSPPLVPGFVPPNFDTSLYEVPVSLPNCDGNALILDESTDLNQVDWHSHDVFCVLPGNYTSWGEVLIEDVDGTAGQPKVFRYYDPTDAEPPHPVDRVNLPSQEAVFQNIQLSRSNYWILNGLTIRNSPTYNLIVDSSNNVLNRLLIEGGDASLLRISRDSDNNVIQNSVLRNQSDIALREDKVCLLLYTQDWDHEGIQMENTHIVNNEIYNCNDGVQLLRSSVERPALYPGTIVENNDIYITSDLFMDCKGNHDPNGACACAENAIDIKATIKSEDLTNPDTWVRIINNRIWGYRHTDDTDDGQGNRLCGSGSNGAAIVSHNYSRALVIRGNVIMDSPIGITLDRVEMPDPPLTNHFIVNNLLYNIHNCYDPDKQGMKQFYLHDEGQFLGCIDENNGYTEDHGKGLKINGIEDQLIAYGNTLFGNTVVDVGDRENMSGEWADILDAADTYQCNVVLNSPGKEYNWHQTNRADKNGYYNSIAYCPGSAPCEEQYLIEKATVGAAGHTTFTFQRKRWSGLEEIAIPDSIRTSLTPKFSSGGICWVGDPRHPWNQ